MENNPSTAHWQVMCKNLQPGARGECLRVCITFTFPAQLKGSSIPVRVPCNTEAVVGRVRRCASLQPRHFIYVALKLWRLENQSPL